MNDNYYRKNGEQQILSLPELQEKYGKGMTMFTNCRNCKLTNYFGHIQDDCSDYEPELKD